MHPVNCRHCNSKNKIDFDVKISKIDAIGFFLVSLLLTGPIWLITLGWANLPPEIKLILFFVCFVISSFNKQIGISLLFLSLILAFPLELIEQALEYIFSFYDFNIKDKVAAIAFAFTFYKIGCKVYGFFFLCVDYSFNFKVFCSSCGSVLKNIALPK